MSAHRGLVLSINCADTAHATRLRQGVRKDWVAFPKHDSFYINEITEKICKVIHDSLYVHGVYFGFRQMYCSRKHTYACFLISH